MLSHITRAYEWVDLEVLLCLNISNNLIPFNRILLCTQTGIRLSQKIKNLQTFLI